MNPKTDGRILPPADENDKKSNDVLFPVRKQDVFLVEHLAKASRRRSLRLVRTIPVHLMSASGEAQHEFSAAR